MGVGGDDRLQPLRPAEADRAHSGADVGLARVQVGRGEDGWISSSPAVQASTSTLLLVARPWRGDRAGQREERTDPVDAAADFAGPAQAKIAPTDDGLEVYASGLLLDQRFQFID